ncbi:MAG: hypothetical protein ACREL9_06365 [Gemmatimonadales bacterium]
MTLGRLIVAWLPVAAWLAASRYALMRGRLRLVPPEPPEPASAEALLVRAALPVGFAESIVVTLLAALWFDSLGHGGWWLLFALIGLVHTLPPLVHQYWLSRRAARAQVVGFLLDTARYVVAGGLLAWLLG